MTESTKALVESAQRNFNFAPNEERPQVAPLRDYAYQLHQSVAAWINLPEGATLHLEVTED